MSQTKIRSYSHFRRLPHASFGRLYRATCRDRGRQVMILIFPADYFPGDLNQNTFFRELARYQSLSLPHMGTVYEAFQEKQEIFFVYECVEGRNLADYIHRGTLLSPHGVVLLLRSLLPDLQTLYAANILHRGLFPDNIMVSRSGRFVLTQPMIYRWSCLQRLSKPALRYAPYLAREVLQNRLPDFRSELYCLGITCYEALCGRLPFERGPIDHVIQQKKEMRLQLELPDATREAMSHPTVFLHMIHRLAASDHEQRYQTIHPLLDDVHVCAQPLPEHHQKAPPLLCQAPSFRLQKHRIGNHRTLVCILFCVVFLWGVVMCLDRWIWSLSGYSRQNARTRPPLSQAEKMRIGDLLADARRAYEAQEYLGALYILAEALSMDHGHREVTDFVQEIQERLVLASTRYQEGLQAYKNFDWEKAAEAFIEVLDLNPREYKELLREKLLFTYNNLGDLYIQRNQFRQALESYFKAQYLDPNNPIVSMNLSAAYFGLRSYYQAIDTCEKALRTAADMGMHDERLLETYRIMGLSYIEIEQYEEGIDHLQRYLRENPDSDYRTQVLQKLADVQGLRRLELTASFERLRDLYKKRDSLWGFLQQRQFKRAVELCEQAVQQNPNPEDPQLNDVYRVLGLSFYELGDLKSAKTYLDHYLTVYPQSSEREAVIELSEEMRSRSQEDLRQNYDALRHAYDVRAQSLVPDLQNHRLRRALTDYREALRKNIPSQDEFYVDAYRLMGLSHLALGIRAKAQENIDIYLRVFPDSPHRGELKAVLEGMNVE